MWLFYINRFGSVNYPPFHTAKLELLLPLFIVILSKSFSSFDYSNRNAELRMGIFAGVVSWRSMVSILKGERLCSSNKIMLASDANATHSTFISSGASYCLTNSYILISETLYGSHQAVVASKTEC